MPYGHGGGWHRGPTACWPSFRFFKRRFLTREEWITLLEKYLKDLRAEVKAVEELLAKLKEEKTDTAESTSS